MSSISSGSLVVISRNEARSLIRSSNLKVFGEATGAETRRSNEQNDLSLGRTTLLRAYDLRPNTKAF